MACVQFQLSLLILVIGLLGAYQSFAAPVCSRLSSSDLKKLQVCNLTGYSSSTYFWDKEGCLLADQQLVTLIESFSDQYWKNKVDYPSSCLEQYVRYSCSEACPICALPDYVKPPTSTSQLDQLYLSVGQGLTTCTERCTSFIKSCNSTPGISTLTALANCTDLSVSVLSSLSAPSSNSKPKCTNHVSTLLANNSNINSPESLGYSTCDAGLLNTFKPQICTTSNHDQMIWNDRSGPNQTSTCQQKDSSLADVLPHFVTTFNTYNICVEDYQDCLDAYADFVCSSSCPYCNNNQSHDLPCKSQCQAIVSTCAGLPVLNVTAKMNCSSYLADSCTSMSSKGVPEIIDENANKSIECPPKNETNTTTSTRSVGEEWLAVSNEDIIHSLLNYRFQPDVVSEFTIETLLTLRNQDSDSYLPSPSPSISLTPSTISNEVVEV